jgi:hypothetical protein
LYNCIVEVFGRFASGNAPRNPADPFAQFGAHAVSGFWLGFAIGLFAASVLMGVFDLVAGQSVTLKSSASSPSRSFAAFNSEGQFPR